MPHETRTLRAIDAAYRKLSERRQSSPRRSSEYPSDHNCCIQVITLTIKKIWPSRGKSSAGPRLIYDESNVSGQLSKEMVDLGRPFKNFALHSFKIRSGHCLVSEVPMNTNSYGAGPPPLVCVLSIGVPALLWGNRPSVGTTGSEQNSRNSRGRT